MDADGQLGYDPVSLTLAPEAGAPAIARRRAVALTSELLADERRGDLELLVSELVSNAVLHGAGDIELVLCRVDGYVRVEVTDQSPKLPERQPPTGTDGGFGLRLLEHLSDSWGVDGRANGKTVWFHI